MCQDSPALQVWTQYLNADKDSSGWLESMARSRQLAHTHSGFAHPDFRGRRLHGPLKVHALRALAARGVDVLLSDIHWANYASIRSCVRVGYQTLGNLYTVGHGQRRFIHVPAAARSLGLLCENRGIQEPPNHLATNDRTVIPDPRNPVSILSLELDWTAQQWQGSFQNEQTVVAAQAGSVALTSPGHRV